MRRLTTVLFLSAMAASIPTIASAEWLSLRDSGLVETKGPWMEKGKMVVYTAMTGPLMSMRASEIDLVMSRAIGTRMKKVRYVDLGIAADPSDPNENSALIDERGIAEQKRLSKFVKDPQAHRVSGTLSAQSNESALANVESQMESSEEALFRNESDSCSRFEGTSAKNVCHLRASISSEVRKDEADRRAEADGETYTESE